MRRRARIAGLGRHLPERVVTNADLARLMDTSDAWIRARTGIRERRWVEGEVGASDLALPAAREALKAAGVRPTELDLIIFATLSPDITFPGSGCLLQAKLGCATVPALDVRNQCTGFLYGLAVADAFIRAGTMSRVLLVGAEVHSTGLDLSDRGRDVSVLFGDGAGAAVLVASEDGSGVLGTRLHADGSEHELLMIEAPASRHHPRIDHAMIDEGRHYPRMDGRGVFRRAVSRVPEVLREVLDAHGLAPADIDLLVPHQANRRINDAVARKLGIPEERVVQNIDRYGNTTAASIPIALSEAVEEGRLRSGDLLAMAAFGAGLTWAASLVRW